MPKDPKSKKVSKAKAAKNTVDVEIAAEVVDDSKPKLKKGKKPKKTPKDPKSKKVSKAKAAKNTVDVEIAAEVVDDSKPKLKKGKKPKKTYN